MRRFVALAALGIALGSPGAASAFGTVDAIGQNREHEFITRAALECPGKPSFPDLPGRCFQPLSTDEVPPPPPFGPMVGPIDCSQLPLPPGV